MVDVLADDIERFVRTIGPDPDETLREMDAVAEREGFPHVGPEVGGFLRFTARMSDAERIFEFGSGYGYSAYWMVDTLPADGEIVLTDVDSDVLERAREYLERGGYADIARFELGDAQETIEEYDGPFDVVLIDHQKERYVEALEAVRPKVPVGGVVVADNAITASPVDFDDLRALLDSDDPSAAVVEANEATRGVADYLEKITGDPDFETILLPLGEGIAVSYRVS
ncbi:Predicted O-methyltransferase YrrM [Natronorubrum sediminis]|uniref:Predicted O-methyltransferase YrrM n=1 Tax=Natronorubrum sediminis TaxID=640943 RepID=A0A1H6FND5_9EURY|nr:O-methyltransferase [Natronorubrum sediminis]SEH12417.1 Predicted O-methyltransferase YrrM [Natronorubrum sediminis]